MIARILTFLLCLTTAAMAQSVQQSGSVTPGHAAAWLTNGVIQDAGTAASGKFTSLGTTGQGPTICANSAPISQPYVAFCLAANTNSAAILSLQNYGGASAQPLQFNINGTVYDFPYTVGGIVGPGSSTVGDAACWNNSSGNLLKDCGYAPLTNALSSGEIFVGSIGGVATAVTMSGDCTIVASGEITCTKLNSVSPGAIFPLNIGTGLSSSGGNLNFVSVDAGGATSISNGVSGGVLYDNGGKIAAGGAVNSQSGAYTIAATDCFGIVVETGAFQTITLPSSLTGFPSSCPVRIVNGSSSRAQALANFPSSLPSGCGGACLWPNQGITVGVVSGAWAVISAPGLWEAVNGAAFNVSTTGSDDNDCLGGGTGACASVQQAYNLCQQTQSFSVQPSISVAAGSYSIATSLLQATSVCPGANQIQVLGAGSGSVTITTTASPTNGLVFLENAKVLLTGFTFKMTGTGPWTGFNLADKATLDFGDIIFGNFPNGGTAFNGNFTGVLFSAHSNVTFSDTIGGSSVGTFLNLDNGAQFQLNGFTITFSGTSWSLTDGCVVENGSLADLTGTVTQSASMSGTRWVVSNLALLNNSSSGAKCPGGTNGSSASGNAVIN